MSIEDEEYEGWEAHEAFGDAKSEGTGNRIELGEMALDTMREFQPRGLWDAQNYLIHIWKAKEEFLFEQNQN